jgi:serine protease Do
MVVLRNGEKLTLNITVEAMPEKYGETMRDPEDEPSPDQGEKESFDELGLDVRELTPEIAKQLGMPDAKGVLISGVKDGSFAERAGLRAGLVIELIGKTTVTSPEEFRNAMKGQSVKDGISMLIRTPGGTRIIVIQSS